MIQGSGEGWTSYKAGTVPFFRPHVRMGCVMYPFDLSQIETSGFLASVLIMLIITGSLYLVSQEMALSPLRQPGGTR